MTIAQHSSATNEHYTPSLVVEPARRLLGGFDLDPASCPIANETVKASRIFTIADDGLSQPWSGRVFVNPPGGRLKQVSGRWVPVVKGGDKEKRKAVKGARRPASSMQVWWDTLVRFWLSGEVTEAFFVAFTLEILRTSQACALPVQAFPRCYPTERLCFGGDDPTHANVLVYLPPRGSDALADLERMTREFGAIGACEAKGIGSWEEPQQHATPPVVVLPGQRSLFG
jgi:hypothetical protein